MIAYLTAIDRRDGLAVSAEANVGVPTLCRSQNISADEAKAVSAEANVGVPTLCRSQNRQLMMGRAV